MKRILLVEDDPHIAELIRVNVEEDGYRVRQEANGARALELALEQSFDLIILDLMLPGMDGIEFCNRFRREDRMTPIIMVTAKSEELDRVLGLEIGADDYITKPFSVRELVARIHALRRRIETDRAESSTGKEPDSADFGALSIHFLKRRVTLKGESVPLTAKEYDLLELFTRNPGRAFSRRVLLDTVWGYQFEGYDHTVNSHINRLRSKIEQDPSSPRYIRTVWGVGYRFAEPTEVDA